MSKYQIGKKKVITKYGKINVCKEHVLSPCVGRKGFRISPYLQELGCLVGQLVPFDEGSELLKRLGHCELSDKQIERLSHFHGEQIETLEAIEIEESISEILDEPEKQTDLSYTMVDGSMLFTREDGWKEIKLGRIFTAASILPYKQRKEISSSEYLAHLGKSNDFLNKFGGYMDKYSNLVAIADGARWIWNYFDTYRPDVIQILDVYHAAEKLGHFAGLYFEKDQEEEKKQWIGEQKERLMTDKVNEVIKIVALIKCKSNASSAQNALLTYYRNKQSR